MYSYHVTTTQSSQNIGIAASFFLEKHKFVWVYFFSSFLLPKTPISGCVNLADRYFTELV